MSGAELQRLERHGCFGGWQEVWEHDSAVLGCRMRFAIYLPPQAAQRRCPVLYWLSGLTCSEQNFIVKAGAQRHAAEHGLIVVAADTSPRGAAVADDPAWDLGQGAGFYVNATRAPWAAHYRMYDYVGDELPALVEHAFPASDRRAIAGHSMGGHGALVLALRNPQRYASLSAFAPISAPASVDWGRKALAAYLGDDPAGWADYDATRLLAAGHRFPGTVLVDQGGDDAFLDQLQPRMLEQACAAADQPLQLRIQPGYDHSYYFIASFIGEHVGHHAAALAANTDRHQAIR
jgi:S-formylglutathione hydrolase